MQLEVTGPVWYWRGPAPWHFVTVPDEPSVQLESAASVVSYGWGIIPVTASVGATDWYTALWPKDGRYVVPLKTAVRRAEGIEVDDVVTVRLLLDL